MHLEYIKPQKDQLRSAIDLYKFCVQQELLGHAEEVLKHVLLLLSYQPMIYAEGGRFDNDRL